MNVLLDECVPRLLCRELAAHTCRTAQEAGFAGKKNGDLLKLAEEHGFDVLLTVDKSMQHEQRFRGRALALLLVQCGSTDIDRLLPHVPAIRAALRKIKPGQIVRVPD
jgi:Domain of unknown function (DUF5615)